MLAPIKHILATKRIILASGSPRRKELVKLLDLDAELCPSTFEENLKPGDYAEFSKFVEDTALGKAEEVYERLQSKNCNGEAQELVVIAADTMVTMGSDIYGKPKDADDAVRILTNLSGKCNRVFTGVVIKYANGVKSFTETAEVYFDNLNQQQIQAYVDTGIPLDKAGAFGINDIGGSMISKINGDYYCVMGLPLNRLCRELLKIYGA